MTKKARAKTLQQIADFLRTRAEGGDNTAIHHGVLAAEIGVKPRKVFHLLDNLSDDWGFEYRMDGRSARLWWGEEVDVMPPLSAGFRARFLWYVERNPGMTVNEIKDGIGAQKSTIYNMVRRLENSELIWRDWTSGRGRVYFGAMPELTAPDSMTQLELDEVDAPLLAVASPKKKEVDTTPASGEDTSEDMEVLKARLAFHQRQIKLLETAISAEQEIIDINKMLQEARTKRDAALASIATDSEEKEGDPDKVVLN